MSSAFETSLGKIRQDAVRFGTEGVDEMVRMASLSAAKVSAGEYTADDAASDLARSATMATRNAARAANVFLQVVAAFGTLSFDQPTETNGDDDGDDSGDDGGSN